MTSRGVGDYCVILALNQITYDSRVLRVARYFRRQQRSAEVRILGLGGMGTGEFGELKVVRAARPGNSLCSCLTYLLTVLITAFQLRGRRGLVWATDADSLLFGYGLSLLLGGRLIYDAHEFWPAEARRRSLGWALLKIESWLIRRVEAVVTVSPSLANAYQQYYKLPSRPSIILNVPDVFESEPARGLPSLYKAGWQTFVYQGHLVEDRRIMDFVKTFRKIRKGRPWRLAFLGYGPLQVGLTRLQGEDLVVLEAVPPDRLLAVTRTANAGLVLLDSGNPNHCLSLTNKLFEYLAAGLPVLASGCSQDTREFVARHQVGAIFCDYTEGELEAGLTRLVSRDWGGALAEVQEAISWHHQEQVLNDLIEGRTG
jgi:glycosyltransferase involved in cell wall biosynthesis